jgi:Na+-transporting NADH:ubiquinone oxidoreductase subunit NqrC
MSQAIFLRSDYVRKKYVLKNKKRFLIVVITSLTMACSLIFASSAYGYKEPRYQVIKIKKGDTLWELAQCYGNNGDIRKYIYDIKKLNKLSSSEIFEGDYLKIPR